MKIEVVNPETFERTKYETWSCDDRGTQQCIIEVGGKAYAVNVIPDEPICAKPRLSAWREYAKGEAEAGRYSLRPITIRVRHPERP